jgi:hypothetical protein
MTLKTLRNVLKTLPSAEDEYAGAYDGAVDRIRMQRGEQGRRGLQALAWVVCANRRLLGTELECAVTIEAQSRSLDATNILNMDDIVSACVGLVVVEQPKGLVRLIHSSAQQRLSLTLPDWYPDSELLLAEGCLTYLLYDKFQPGTDHLKKAGKTGKGERTTPLENLSDVQEQALEVLQDRITNQALYEYAAQNWGHHARRAGECVEVWKSRKDGRAIGASEMDERMNRWSKVEQQIETIVNDKGRLWDASRVVMVREDAPIWRRNCDPGDVTGLHLAAYFGLTKAMRLFLDKDSIGANTVDSDDWTPLHWAAESGQAAAAKLLMERGADISAADNRRWTAVHKAVTAVKSSTGDGHAVLSLFVGNKTAINQLGRKRVTMLHLAAADGDLRLAELLLDNGANLEAKVAYEFTPLSDALAAGEVEMAEFLLTRGADLGARDRPGGSLLHRAAENVQPKSAQ